MTFPITNSSNSPFQGSSPEEGLIGHRKEYERDLGWERQLVICTRTDMDGGTFWGSRGARRGLVTFLRGHFQTSFSVSISMLARGAWASPLGT